MDPAINQTPVEDLSAGDWKAQMKSGKIELEKCLSACDTRDLNQFRNQVQKSFRHLGDANVETLLDQTVLESCWVEGARCLLEQGANPNTIPPGSLIWQCRSLGMLQLLAEFGMDYKSKTCNILGDAIGQREILDWLLDQGLDINGPTNEILSCANGTTARDNTVLVLNLAAYYGDIDLFDHLVARGANPSHSIALHYATKSDNAPAMIAHLIDKYQFDVNADYSCGGLNELTVWGDGPSGSPLNYAVEYNNLPAAEALLKYGAEIGGAPSIAICKEFAPILKLFLDKGTDPTEALDTAARRDFIEGCQLCLENGGDISVVEARDREVIVGSSLRKKLSTEVRMLLHEWK